MEPENLEITYTCILKSSLGDSGMQPWLGITPLRGLNIGSLNIKDLLFFGKETVWVLTLLQC